MHQRHKSIIIRILPRYNANLIEWKSTNLLNGKHHWTSRITLARKKFHLENSRIVINFYFFVYLDKNLFHQLQIQHKLWMIRSPDRPELCDKSRFFRIFLYNRCFQLSALELVAKYWLYRRPPVLIDPNLNGMVRIHISSNSTTRLNKMFEWKNVFSHRFTSWLTSDKRIFVYKALPLNISIWQTNWSDTIYWSVKWCKSKRCRNENELKNLPVNSTSCARCTTATSFVWNTRKTL